MSFIPNGANPDKSTFTEGTSLVTVVGGEWNDSSATLTSGQSAGLRITEKRAAHVNLRNETGTEIGTASNPLQTNVTNFPATQVVSGTVAVSNFPATQPVSGTVTANAGTGTFNVQDAADGTPASAIPAKALLVGASDGTDLRPLLSDTSGNLQVLPAMYSGNIRPLLVANKVIRGSLTTTTPVTIFTAAAGYYVAGLTVSFSSNIAASNNNQTIIFSDSVFGVINALQIALPTAAVAWSTPSMNTFNSPPGFFWSNTSLGSSLTASLTVALTSGSVTYQIYYGTVPYLI